MVSPWRAVRAALIAAATGPKRTAAISAVQVMSRLSERFRPSATAHVAAHSHATPSRSRSRWGFAA